MCVCMCICVLLIFSWSDFSNGGRFLSFLSSLPLDHSANDINLSSYTIIIQVPVVEIPKEKTRNKKIIIAE